LERTIVDLKSDLSFWGAPENVFEIELVSRERIPQAHSAYGTGIRDNFVCIAYIQKSQTMLVFNKGGIRDVWDVWVKDIEDIEIKNSLSRKSRTHLTIEAHPCPPGEVYHHLLAANLVEKDAEYTKWHDIAIRPIASDKVGKIEEMKPEPPIEIRRFLAIIK